MQALVPASFVAGSDAAGVVPTVAAGKALGQRFFRLIGGDELAVVDTGGAAARFGCRFVFLHKS